MLYNNMISVTNTWVGQGKMSPGIGLWAIHAVMLTLTLLMFYRRMTLFSLSRWLAKGQPHPKASSLDFQTSVSEGTVTTSPSGRRDGSEEPR